MEIQVDIVKAEIQGSQGGDSRSLEDFDLNCRAESGEETQTHSAVLNIGEIDRSPRGDRERAESSRQWPQFKFNFRRPNSTAELLFTVFTNPSDSLSTLSSSSSFAPAELGSCVVPLVFQVDHRLEPFYNRAAIQTRVAYLSSRVEGTDVNKFVGKIWFKVDQKLQSSLPTMMSQSSWVGVKFVQEQLSPRSNSNQTPPAAVLLSRELEQTCHYVLPSITPTVSVVFHSVNFTNLERTGDQLSPIACLGTNSVNIKNEAIFQSSGINNSVIPILKPVTLACDDHENLELHIADTTTDDIIFSASHQLKTLAPFRHYNWQYDRKWKPGTSPLSMSRPVRPDQGSSNPNVIASLVYRPVHSDFAHYEGLELLIMSPNLNPALQDKNIVVCVQLVSSNSKSKVLGRSDLDSPFPRRKLQKGNSIQQSDSNISVVRFRASPTQSAYFFFPAESYFAPGRVESDFNAYILVYAVDPISPYPWWQTPLVVSCRLVVSENALRALRLPSNHQGAYWGLSKQEISQPEGLEMADKICGVVRWKSTRIPFLTSTIETQLNSLPDLGSILPEPKPDLSDWPLASPTSNQSSLGQAVPEVDVLSTLLAEHEASMDDHDLAKLAEYRKAVTVLGMDVLRLRQENGELQRANEQLLNKIARMQNAAATVNSPEQRVLETLPKAELVKRLAELQHSLVTECENTKLYRDRVEALQNSLIRSNNFEAQYIQLQEAHTAQQKLVRQFQAKLTKYRRCGAICKQQEILITHLESLLAQQAQRRGDGEAVSLLTRENSMLRAALQEYQDGEPDHKYLALREKEDLVQSLKAQLSRVTSKCHELEERLTQGSRSGQSENLQLFELEQKLAVSEARAETLMRELQENARRGASEKTRCELQLAELRGKVAAMTELQHGQPSTNTTARPPAGESEISPSPNRPSDRNPISF